MRSPVAPRASRPGPASVPAIRRGGQLAFGIIGLFVGPVVLAVSYTPLAAWVADRRAAAE